MSTLRVNTLQNTSGVEVYTCKAWVNFTGTGTVTINAAGNVSSITDNGVADYTANFTVAMTDANYAAVISGVLNTGGGNFPQIIAPANLTDALTTTSLRIFGGGGDFSKVLVAIFR
jgi:hypothetical protein